MTTPGERYRFDQEQRQRSGNTPYTSRLNAYIENALSAATRTHTARHGRTDLSNRDISELIWRLSAHNEVTCSRLWKKVFCTTTHSSSLTTHLVYARLNSISITRRHNGMRTPGGILGPLLGPSPRLVCRARRGVDARIFSVFLPVRNRASSSAPCLRTRVECTRTET